MMLLEVGILFDRGNYTELAEKILRLSHEKELSKKPCESCLKRVKETFLGKTKLISI